MEGPRDNQSARPATGAERLFSDLRERNEYGRRVNQLLKAQRDRHIEQVMQAQRRHRVHQAR